LIKAGDIDVILFETQDSKESPLSVYTMNTILLDSMFLSIKRRQLFFMLFFNRALPSSILFNCSKETLKKSWAAHRSFKDKESLAKCSNDNELLLVERDRETTILKCELQDLDPLPRDHNVWNKWWWH
jgi:hypothetical protein